MKSLVILVGLSLATLAVGCASGGDSSDDVAGAGADLSHSDAPLRGTFESVGANDLLENSFTFNADHTYKALGGCSGAGSGPHCFAITEETGTWKIAKSGPQLGSPGGAQELVLTSDLDHAVKTFFLQLSSDGSDLSLSTVFDGPSTHFTKNTGSVTTTSAKDELVGSWADAKDAALSFHAITLKKDATYTAQGGCRPQEGCFAITEEQGTWKLAVSGPELGAPAGAQELVLTDNLGKTTTLFFTLDSSGKDLTLGAALVGDQGHFAKQ